MTKVVYNACFGGFGLSDKAILRYAELKGWTLYPEKDPRYEALGIGTWWKVPPQERTGILKEGEWSRASIPERQESNRRYSESVLYDRDIPRSDPDLVRVVEELGEEANTRFSKLEVSEVEGKWRIDEYDGNERVMTPDSYEWEQ